MATVNSGDALIFTVSLCGATTIDNGVWGPLSIAFHPRGSAATLQGYTRNAIVQKSVPWLIGPRLWARRLCWLMLWRPVVFS